MVATLLLGTAVIVAFVLRWLSIGGRDWRDPGQFIPALVIAAALFLVLVIATVAGYE